MLEMISGDLRVCGYDRFMCSRSLGLSAGLAILMSACFQDPGAAARACVPGEQQECDCSD